MSAPNTCHRPQAVLFDLDGTLVDSLADIIAAVHLLERELGLPGCTDQQVSHWIGQGARVLVRRVVAGDRDSLVDEPVLEQAFAIFMRHYAQQGTLRTRLYADAEQVLKTLRQQGIRIGLVTNKPKAITLDLLDTLNIAHYFAVVLGGGDVARPKPQPDMLLAAAAQLGVRPQDCLMVGDSSNDVQAARHADMPVAAVRGGYNHGEPIEYSQPDWVLDKLADLLPLLRIAT